jgi:hypothetical protein
MFEPVFYYLVEAVRVCARAVDLPASQLAVWLVAVATVLTAVLALRARVGR